MFNSKDLLGQLMGSGLSQSGGQRVQHAVGDRNSPLADLLSGLTGGGAATGSTGTGGAAAGGAGGILGSLAGMAGQVLNSTKQGVQSNNPAAVGGLGALAGALLGGRSGALGGGALALLGSLAYSALNPKEAASNPTPEQIAEKAPVGLRPPQNAAEEAELEDSANVIMLAMINAAKADGHVGPDEMQRIMGKLKEAGAEQEGIAFLMGEIQKPLDMQSMVARVRSPELAAEVYAASLLAIEIDTDAERQYLRNLAHALNLPPEPVARLHQALGVPAV